MEQAELERLKEKYREPETKGEKWYVNVIYWKVFRDFEYGSEELTKEELEEMVELIDSNDDCADKRGSTILEIAKLAKSKKFDDLRLYAGEKVLSQFSKRRDYTGEMTYKNPRMIDLVLKESVLSKGEILKILKKSEFKKLRKLDMIKSYVENLLEN